MEKDKKNIFNKIVIIMLALILFYCVISFIGSFIIDHLLEPNFYMNVSYLVALSTSLLSYFISKKPISFRGGSACFVFLLLALLALIQLFHIDTDVLNPIIFLFLFPVLLYILSFLFLIWSLGKLINKPKVKISMALFFAFIFPFVVFFIRPGNVIIKNYYELTGRVIEKDLFCRRLSVGCTIEIDKMCLKENPPECKFIYWTNKGIVLNYEGWESHDNKIACYYGCPK